MANRYWAGGAGTWDNSATVNWSAALPLALTSASCSGTTLTTTGSPALVVGMKIWSSTNVSLGLITAGSGNSWTVSVGGTYAAQSMTAATIGASAPTSTDSVFFGTTSSGAAYTVTIGLTAVQPNCLDLTAVGATGGTLTFSAAATAVLNVYGSWTSAATGVAFSTTSGSAINFVATSTGKTVTTNNISLGAWAINFNGFGGGWTLGSAITNTSTTGFNIITGTFSTGNFGISCYTFSGSGTLTRSITLGTSTITATSTSTAINFTTVTNLTFSGASSTMVLSGASPAFAGGGLSFGTVNFTATTSSTTSITGTNTFVNLSITGRSADGFNDFSIGGNQTITGTLSFGTNTSVRRLFLHSSVQWTQRTITAAAVTGLSDVDFQDIVAAGASGTWSGTRLGNRKNNSNITFPTAKTVYLSTVSGANATWSGTSWANTSGGTPDLVNFPLAQDIAIIDDSGATTGNGLRTNGTITLDLSWAIGTLTSTRTSAYTFVQGNQDPAIYGNLTLSSGITISGSTSPTWTFEGYGTTQTITCAGKTIPASSVTITSPTGTVRLLDAYTQGIPSTGTTAQVTLTNGTLDLNGFTLTSLTFNSSTSTARTIAFGSTGKILVNGGAGTSQTVFTTSTVTNLTVTGSANVECYLTSSYNNTGTTRTISAGSGISEANALNFYITGGGVDTVSLSAGHAFKNFNNTGAGANSILSLTTTFTSYGNLALGTGTTFTTTTPTSAITFAATSGTKTITTNGVALNKSLTFNGVGGTWQLTDNLTSNWAANTNVVLTAGTLDLNNNVLTTGTFNSSGSTARTLTSGASGSITVNGNATTVWNTGVATNLTYTTIPTVTAGYTGSTGTRIVSTAGVADRINLYLYGSDTFTPASTFTVNDYDFGNFSGTVSNITTQIYGNLKLALAAGYGGTFTAGSNIWTFKSTSGTKLIYGGAALNNPIVFDGVGGTWQLMTDITNNSTTTLTNGTLDLNGAPLYTGAFLSNNSNTRTLKFGPDDGSYGTASPNAYWTYGDGKYGYIGLYGTNSTIFDMSNITNATIIGSKAILLYPSATSVGQTRTLNLPLVSNGATGVHAFNVGLDYGSEWNDTITLPSTSYVCKLLEVGSSGYGTLTTGPANLYGNFYSYRTIDGPGPLYFKGNMSVSSTVNITKPVIVDCTSSNTVTLNSALTLDQYGSNGIFTWTSGNINTNWYTLTCDKFYSANNSSTRSLYSYIGDAGGYASPVVYVGYGNSAGGNGHIAWDTSNSSNIIYVGYPEVYSTYAPAGYIRKFATSGPGDRINLILCGSEANNTVEPVAPFYVNNYQVGLVGNYIGADFYGTLKNVETKIYGDLTMGYGTIGTYLGGANTFTFQATDTNADMTTYGMNMDWPFVIDTDYTVSISGRNSGGSFLAKSITLNKGTLDFSDGPTYLESFTSNTASYSYRVIDLGSNYLTLSGTGTVWDVNDYNVDAKGLYINRKSVYNQYSGTIISGIIRLTGTTAIFNGGGYTYASFDTYGLANNITIKGANTFKAINWNSNYAGTLRFPAGKTTTIENSLYAPTTLSGLNIFSDTTGTQATLYMSTASTGIYYGYLNQPTVLKDIAATNPEGVGAVNYAAAGSYSLGNVTGWTFSNDGAMMMFL